MGRAKAWLVVDGVPMAVHVASVLQMAGCRPVRFVGAAPPADIAARIGVDIETVADREPGEGPLGGVLTALRSCDADVVVAACDLPSIGPDDVRAVLQADPARQAGVVVAVADGHHVPLALWRRSALPAMTEIFVSGARSWRAALDAIDRVEVPLSGVRAFDVDTPADLRSVRRRVDHGSVHCPLDSRR
jgi:molybdenum cofactor guanylyltransferase